MRTIVGVLGCLLVLASCGEEKAATTGSDGAASTSKAISSDEGQVREALASWCASQTEGDFDAYAAFYADEFEGIKRSKKKKKKTYDQKRWLKDRGRMFKKPLHVDCLNPRVTFGADNKTVSVTFEQYWRSPTYADQGDKRLDMKKTPQGWRFVGEEMLNSTKWDTVSFRDGSPAPEARFKTDETKVKVPQMLIDMTTKQGPKCYRKCLKKKPKNWRDVITTNGDYVSYPSKDGCSRYCIELHGAFE